MIGTHFPGYPGKEGDITGPLFQKAHEKKSNADTLPVNLQRKTVAKLLVQAIDKSQNHLEIAFA